MPTIYENMCNPETHKRKVDLGDHYTYLAYYLFKNSNGDLVKGELNIILLEKEISDEYRSYIENEIEDIYNRYEVEGEVVIEEIADDYLGLEYLFRKSKSVWEYYSEISLYIKDIGLCKVFTYEPEQSFVNNYFFVNDRSDDKDSAKFAMINMSKKKFFITIDNNYIGIYQDTFFDCTPYIFNKKREGLLDDDLVEFMNELEELLNIKIIYAKKHIVSSYEAIKERKEEEEKVKVAKKNKQLRLSNIKNVLFSAAFIICLFIDPVSTILFMGYVIQYVYIVVLFIWIFLTISNQTN